MFREIAPQELQDNPFTLIGKDWLLITAGNREKCNTPSPEKETASAAPHPQSLARGG